MNVSKASASDQHQSLHIAYAVGSGGGAETYVRQIAKSLSAQGQQVTVIYICSPQEILKGAPFDDGIRLEYARISNVHYYYDRLFSYGPPAVRQVVPGGALVKAAEASVALRRTLQRVERATGRVDILEVAEEAAFSKLFRGIVPYAVKLHGSDATVRYFCHEGLRRDDYQRIHVESRLLREACLVSAPSKAVADHIASMCDFPRSKIVVFPLPLDLELFSPASNSNADPVQSVLYVGRMDGRKGLKTLACAAATILAAVADATIDIVGEETEEVNAKSLLVYVPEMFHRRIVFHGRVSRAALPDYYRRAAICVVPSCWESFGYTLAEAMACGTPVVASHTGSVPELITDGTTGLLVPRGEPEALALSVLTLLRDPARRKAMGEAAREDAVKRLAPHRIASQSLKLYRAALAGTGGHPPRAS